MNNENLSISYNKLWKLLIDRGMKKKDLQQASGVSAASIAKLGRNGNVTTEVLLKVCKALDCDISDIMEIVKES
ncbi:helix-turn-helix transcriptional regulator [Limosilactobacillus fermentum]|uniref:helix-turn-helix domain-containing protein n=1 Tax=Limosilactobacillus mucosae TaxID=97478 RepID=UPI0015D56CD3|nr:helix-turn-helix transcriptional regulator [Limosilactobacillus mucosae]QLI94908.1 helix-turn-helix transcriptional regulator [Limosilactobacillus mucosae]